MSTRDARGRFVSADVAAAERVLEAAAREAVRLLRGYVVLTRDLPGPTFYSRRVDVIYRTPGDAFDRAVSTLTNATHAADLLLTATDERPAKKAAKRAPRKAGS